MDVLKLLAREGKINESEIETIRQEAAAQGKTVEDVLIKRGINPNEILERKSQELDIPRRELGDTKIPYEVLRYIPEESARHYQIVPLGVVDGVLEVGAVDPDSIEAVDALNFISNKVGLPYKLFLISETDFQKVLEMYKGLSGEVGQALSELETEISEAEGQGGEQQQQQAQAGEAGEVDVGAVGEEIQEDAPVTKIVATILRHAVEAGASDVHVEHTGEKIRVRFRVDGVLRVSLVLPKKVHAAVVARVKILSSMRLDEKRKPQDGRFSTKIKGRRIDFRVSTFPAYHGEKVVMRILDTEKGIHSIEQTGARERTIQQLRDAVAQPHGMILISGPTGSGKTTTLYSLLDEVDRERKNVVSLEDPVEYDIPGVSQAEIRSEIGFTFATGLRTTLRQDPDVIMVGEIRDTETAQLAIQAALTGHLVLSTIHTNSAIGVIPRLIDMGIERYLIAPTLNLAIAQRLVRTLCPGKGKQVPVEGSVKQMLQDQFSDLPEQYREDIPPFDYIYEKEITDDCPEGTSGRSAVFEVLTVDKDIEEVVLADGSEEEIWKIARQNGMIRMREHAIIKALNGEIPFEEVNALGGELLAGSMDADADAQLLG